MGPTSSMKVHPVPKQFLFASYPFNQVSLSTKYLVEQKYLDLFQPDLLPNNHDWEILSKPIASWELGCTLVFS